MLTLRPWNRDIPPPPPPATPPDVLSNDEDAPDTGVCVKGGNNVYVHQAEDTWGIHTTCSNTSTVYTTPHVSPHIKHTANTAATVQGLYPLYVCVCGIRRHSMACANETLCSLVTCPESVAVLNDLATAMGDQIFSVACKAECSPNTNTIKRHTVAPVCMAMEEFTTRPTHLPRGTGLCRRSGLKVDVSRSTNLRFIYLRRSSW